MISELRDNWRIVMLTIFLVASGVALFAPGIGASDGPTNLRYGLDLDGGATVRAPLQGMHVTDVGFDPDRTTDIERSLANEFELDAIDVNAVPSTNGTGAVELYTSNVSKTPFLDALRNAGVSLSEDVEVRPGVTTQTRQTVVETLQRKVNRGGLTGGSVSVIQPVGGGQPFIVVEVPGATEAEVKQRVQDRGVVQIVAEVDPAGENTTRTNTTVLTGEGIAGIQSARSRENAPGVYEVPVTVEDTAARRFAQDMRDTGFVTGNGPENCDRSTDNTKPGSYCLLQILDGEIVQSNGIDSGLASSINNGEWEEDPTFTIGAGSLETAREVEISLQVGALPTQLDISGQGETEFISPSLAEEFKSLALITGLMAWIGVAVMVFLRYKRVRVAIPMLFTAIAEVFILLGFASVVGLALNLSHIAGLIAVIGTGVDDLVIIADEILQQGDVATGRVFQSRFRKAFWVIGAAAITTIIAMSPLAVLSLGELTGFAIVTIVGVLIGVLITRPAYGDILRNLVLRE